MYPRHLRRIILVFIISFFILFLCYNFGSFFDAIGKIKNGNKLGEYPSACLDPWADKIEEFWQHFNQSNLKYISNNPKVLFCSGIGNQMFRLASLYGLGRQLGRIPALSTLTRCSKAEKFVGEFEWIFPLQSKFIKYINFNNKSAINQTYFATKFATQNCCHFDDPKRSNLTTISAKNLLLGGIYLQNFRYFHEYKQNIRNLFRFSPSLCAWAMNERRRIFGSHPLHNLCVHTRRGDFFNRNWQSTKEFTQKSIQFSVQKLHKKFPSISIVLLGDDKQFLRNLEIPKNLTKQIFIPGQNGRGEDMAFAVLSCDSLLITASASTFAWWIGYLVEPKEGHILFNANFTGMDRNRQNFPPEWIPIYLDSKSGQINESN